MAHTKRNDPAANGVEGTAVFSENTATIAQIGAAANSPVITSIRRGPGGKADLVSIKGVCTDTHFRDRKLRNYRKFCNAIRHRFGVTFDPIPRNDWLAIVESGDSAEGGGVMTPPHSNARRRARI